MLFANPSDILSHCNLTSGMKVGDFGAGGGAYTLPLARAVGESGRVYAVDVQRNVLKRLGNTLREEDISHVDLFCSDLEKSGGAKVGDGLLDFVVASNIFFQSNNHEALMDEMRRSLRVGGQLLLVDWADSFGHLGPRAEDLCRPEQVQMLAALRGFTYLQDIPAGRYHYGLMFEKIA